MNETVYEIKNRKRKPAGKLIFYYCNSDILHKTKSKCFQVWGGGSEEGMRPNFANSYKEDTLKAGGTGYISPLSTLELGLKGPIN